MSRLDDIETRLAGATPGPWRADQCGGGEESYSGSWVCPGGHANGVWSNPAECDVLRDETTLSSPDAELIAHAPADLAALVEFARAVQGELGQPNPTTAVIAQALDGLNGGAS